MEIPRHWRLKSQRYQLVGEVCDHCGAHLYPPRDVCPECAHKAQTPYQFSGRGEVYTYTTIYNPPEGYEAFAPYTVAIIKLEEGPLLTAQLTDVEPEQVSIGMPVEMVTRKIMEQGEAGLILYGYKFRPVILGPQ
jgi:uncharacterized protein